MSIFLIHLREPSTVWRPLLALCCVVLAPVLGQAADDTKLAKTADPWTAPAYIRWLEENSMLHQAEQMTRSLAGSREQWQYPYATPQPRAAVKRASVWVLGYPGSVITRPKESVIAAWADPALWKAFEDIGIELLHTGPVNRGGGVREKEFTRTIDGWFDRISLEIDPDIGTAEEYLEMVRVAKKHGGFIAGDLVPLHTGLGPDFRLAQRAYKDYPGLYTMVEIRKEDWHLLPEVKDAWSHAPLPKDAAEKLTELRYIPGLINSADATPKARELSGWDATGAVVGVDGKTRRWVYLHYFMAAQPTMNWLDPSNAAQRVLAGDIVRTVKTLGTKVVRLDAVPFLGIERKPGDPLARHYQHPMSIVGTNYLAFMTRKMGGWSFQELNVSLKELAPFLQNGPDLTYDFITRSQMLHAVLMQDASPLRHAFQFLLESKIEPIQLVHDLQNHDEITYQLVELDYRGDQKLDYQGKHILGRELREQILNEMRSRAAGDAAPYNKLYRPTRDGVATTFAGFIAASLGIRNLDSITPEQIKQILAGHVLLTHANAMQPGVFSLAGWDLVGALPIPEEGVAQWMKDGDYRWINRGGIDLMNVNPTAKKSTFGIPRARTLYGSLPDQLKDESSYVCTLKRMLAARKKYRIAEAALLAAPETDNKSACTLVMQLPGAKSLAVTALNFSQQRTQETLNLAKIEQAKLSEVAGKPVVDVITGDTIGRVTSEGLLAIDLPPWTGKTLLVQP